MLDHVKKCEKCGLCNNQKPLLDKDCNCDVFFVGLSAKKVKSTKEIPLSPETNTGRIIQQIEEYCDNINSYKTNLVKCVPLNNESKLRYPSSYEIDECFDNFCTEIKELSPRIVFLLGEKVSKSVERHYKIKFEKWEGYDFHYTQYEGIYYVPIQHPSYMHVYKRREIEDYIEGVKLVFDTLNQI